MKQLLKDLGFKKLPTLSEFITKLENSNIHHDVAITYPDSSAHEDAIKWDDTTEYVLFIVQPLTEEMIKGDKAIFQGFKIYKHKDYSIPIVTHNGEFFCYKDNIEDNIIEKLINRGVKLKFK